MIPRSRLLRQREARRLIADTQFKVSSRTIEARLFEAQDGRCFICDQLMAAGPFRRNGSYGWTREHVVPVSKGGKNGSNVVLSHRSCNNRRGNPDATAEELAKLAAIHGRLSPK